MGEQIFRSVGEDGESTMCLQTILPPEPSNDMSRIAPATCGMFPLTFDSNPLVATTPYPQHTSLPSSVLPTLLLPSPTRRQHTGLLRVTCHLEHTCSTRLTALDAHAQHPPRNLLLAVAYGALDRALHPTIAPVGLVGVGAGDGRRFEPGHGSAALDEALRSLVDGGEVVSAGDEEVEDLADVVAFVMGRFANLAVREDGIEDAKVGVTEGVCGRGVGGQIYEVAEDDINKDVQVVGVEVFCGLGISEYEVEGLEY
jgi:hypothetical protein